MTTQQRELMLARYAVRSQRFDEIAKEREQRLGRRHDSSFPYEESTATRFEGLASRLSPREVDIIASVAQGLRNAEIGRRHSISEETVKTHVRRILTKLRARNRAHAVAIAIGSELIQAPAGSGR